MTPKERAAMQQALEALEEYRDTQMIKAPRRAITALREAQAGDNMSPTEQAQQESVAEVVLRSHKVGFGRTEERKDIVFLTDVEVGQKLYAAPAQQAEQEPVAWMNDSTPMGVFARHKEGAKNFGCTIPLYAAHVRTKDLTDDEILIALDVKDKCSAQNYKLFLADARAVIAADREKNK